MKTTCFIVSEFGGDFGEQWETPLKVFLSKEKANEYINSINDISEDSLHISQEQYQMAIEIALDDFPDDKKTPLPELILKTGKFPEWSLEDLNLTEEYIRRKEYHWIGFRIDEIELCQ